MSFVLHDDNTIQAWGKNDFGLLGLDSVDTDIHRAAERIMPNINADSLDLLQVNTQTNTALMLSNGELYVWGKNDHEYLGVGSSDPIIRQPTRVTPSAGSDVIMAVQNNKNQTFAVLENGELYAWGNNNDGTI